MEKETETSNLDFITKNKDLIKSTFLCEEPHLHTMQPMPFASPVAEQMVPSTSTETEQSVLPPTEPIIEQPAPIIEQQALVPLLEPEEKQSTEKQKVSEKI